VSTPAPPHLQGVKEGGERKAIEGGREGRAFVSPSSVSRSRRGGGERRRRKRRKKREKPKKKREKKKKE